MCNIFGCYSPTEHIELTPYVQSVSMQMLNDFYNKKWRIQLSSSPGTTSERDTYAILDIDGVNYIRKKISSTSDLNASYDNYYILGGQIEHSSQQFCQMQFKLYSFDIYDDNVLVYSLRPYYDTVDQLYGMYDLVNDRFYSSINSEYPFTGEL